MASVAYLDTHVVVWLYLPRIDLLSTPAQEAIEASELFISPMVRLELTYLKEIGRLTVAADHLITELGKRIGLTVCDLPFTAVVQEAMTMRWTRDPFDRLIVAQASVAQSALISRADGIRGHYPRVVW